MTAGVLDFAVVGGGLSGGLIALALQRARPGLSIALIEQGETIGGNHRWSWFASDLDPAGQALLADMRVTHWDNGYDVRFPRHGRTLSTPYRSLASVDFDAALRAALPASALVTRTAVRAVEANGVVLQDGTRMAARRVIDCRGHVPSEHLAGGWQVFMGRHIRTARPHGVPRPVIMDARVDQVAPDGNDGAYRFVYVLPLGDRDLFVEDTYYADRPALDAALLAGRIDDYCALHGWAGEIAGTETGVLPVITGGDFAAFQASRSIAGVAMAGARAGLVHPLTSYTLPQAVMTALAIADAAADPKADVAAMLETRAAAHWRATRFYRMLGAMLFGAAAPARRFRIFERFYRLPGPLIERFYAARSTRGDMARVLCGKPPVPISGALRALLVRGAPMAQRGTT